jgi:hypothetical protein
MARRRKRYNAAFDDHSGIGLQDSLAVASGVFYFCNPRRVHGTPGEEAAEVG